MEATTGGVAPPGAAVLEEIYYARDNGLSYIVSYAREGHVTQVQVNFD